MGFIMEQATVGFRIDKKLKEDFDKICSELGMNMSTAFAIFAKTVVREKKIPFEVSAEKNKED